MKKDVAIIGGSSAGLFAACGLALRKVPVRVYEASEGLAPQPRTLIVTRQFRDLLGPLGESCVVNRIRRFELFADGRAATVSLCRPDLVIERSRLIRRLAERAEAAGARILTGNRFRSLTPEGKRLRVSLAQNGRVSEESAGVVIGADGAPSRVARSAGWPGQPTAPLLQAVVKLPEDMPPDTTRVWFVPEQTPFFFWLIPHSPTHGVLGLIGPEDGDARTAFDDFSEKKGFDPTDFQAGRIPAYRGWTPNHRRVGENDVYLVGDAAGHVKVSTVGGMVTGLRGALGAVEAILHGAPNGRLRSLQRELDRHRIIRRAIHGFTQSDYVGLLDLLTPSARQSLGRISRDDTGRLLLALLSRQPRLLLLGIRGLLTSK